MMPKIYEIIISSILQIWKKIVTENLAIYS